ASPDFRCTSALRAARPSWPGWPPTRGRADRFPPPWRAEADCPMDTLAPNSAPERSSSHNPLPPMAAVLLAMSLGLCGGYFDLLLMWVQSLWVTEDVPKRIGRDFPWTVPVGHALLLLVPGVLVVVINRLRPGSVSLRAAAWLFATLVIWAALLRMP